MHDLESIEDVPSVPVELVHPTTGKGLGLFYELMGPESAKRRAWQNANGAAVMKTLFGNDEAGEAEEARERERDMILNAVADWWMVDAAGVKKAGVWLIAGKEVPFTAGNLGEVLDDPKRQWVRRQIVARMGRATLFIKDSSSISAAGTPGVSPSTGPSEAQPA